MAKNANLQGSIILPVHENYDEKRKVWNGLIDRRPAAIFECHSETDVVIAVKYAKDRGLSVSVRSGGHHVAGTGVCDDGVMIDMSKLNAVSVDEKAKVAHVEAGAKLSDVDAETQKFGLAVPTGTVSETGIAGLALGGGFGYLRGKYGLTCDNLISAKIVTANGDLIKVSNEENPDLFWAIRGGGGNFGVVTSFEFQLHPVGPDVMAIDVMYDYKDAEEVFQKLNAYMNNVSDDISINTTIVQLPPAPFLPESVHYKRVITVSGMFSGELTLEDEKRVIDPIRQLAEPLLDNSGMTPYTDLQRKLDMMVPDGAEIVGTSLFFRELNDEALEIILNHAEGAPLPMVMAQIWYLNGAMNRVQPDETAFPVRDATALLLLDGAIIPDEPELSQQWMDELYDKLLPYACDKASYLNGAKVDEEITKNTYATNYLRLAQIKRRYDPDNLFCHNHNIEPL